ncbi:MAG: type IV pilus twitching motility protein PilT [Chitinivibrionales bacterium]|nr:type IV pilus twitching motility protein PilT [Chitinivibrionales bacterium]
MTIQELLKKVLEQHASDLHLTAGAPPLFRIDGVLKPLATERLTPEMVQKLAYNIMTEQQRKLFEQTKEIDFSFGIQNLGRFRTNVFLQRGCLACALRQIPATIAPINELGLPQVIEELLNKPNGLILVTGPTGSGKSTTLAAMVDKINSEREGHILTVEDPIEFIHHHKRCIINQREVHHDTESFSNALRVALRQDPDYVLIGEMRDLETIQAALTIAETGHLTFATLHTNSAAKSINRIIDVFPSDQKETVRAQLAMVLQGVISQTLLPKINGGRVLACEIMVATDAIRAMIRDDKVHQIEGIIEISQKFGMQTLNMDLARLVAAHKITKKDALFKSPNPESLLKLMGGMQ